MNCHPHYFLNICHHCLKKTEVAAHPNPLPRWDLGTTIGLVLQVGVVQEITSKLVYVGWLYGCRVI